MEKLADPAGNRAMTSDPEAPSPAAGAHAPGDALDSALKGAAHVSRWLAWIGGAMLLLCAVLVSLDVVFRAALKATYFESFELSSYAFAIATAMGMSYALVSRAHIRIEVLYTLLRPRWRGWLDVVAYALLALCALVLLYWAGHVALGNWQSGARSNSSLAVPLAIPQGLWLIGLAWFALLAVLYTLYGLVKCVLGRSEEAHRRLGVASLEEEIEASGSRGEQQP
jgi:TRAP-type C4-dicarboxylate transport system permease small subunit